MMGRLCLVMAMVLATSPALAAWQRSQHEINMEKTDATRVFKDYEDSKKPRDQQEQQQQQQAPGDGAAPQAAPPAEKPAEK